jgi:KDO2-lipid IV(A) lauroyltransferase
MPVLARLLSALPLRLLHVLGAALGWLAYVLSPTYRRNLQENLALAFPGESGSALRRAAVGHAGRQALEPLWLWHRPQRQGIEFVVQVSGWELVQAARARGEGIVFFTPHLGCFEITAQYLAKDAPITVLYRPPRQQWLQPLIEAGRGRGNVRLARADVGGVRVLMRALKHGEAIGLLPDQVPGKGEGAWVDFFGRPAYTMTLGARLSEVGRTAVLFTYGERLPGGRGFHVHFLAPPVPITGSVDQRATAINRCIEELIRRCPGQYLWGYNRYKKPAGADAPPGTG